MNANSVARAVACALFILNSAAVLSGAEAERRALAYKGQEASWQFVNGPWKTNEAGDLICPAESHWSKNTHIAFNTEQAYTDTVLSGKWDGIRGGAELIVRALDSRRFYAIHFGTQGGTFPLKDTLLQADIWKGDRDGYRRMLAHRSNIGIYSPTDPHRWYDVRVECVGPEIIVYFQDNFVCAIKDDEYKAGLVGVSSTVGISAWKDLEVEGRRATLQPAWSIVEAKLPKQFTVAWDAELSRKQIGDFATLAPNDEILVGFTGDGNKRWITRSRDYGLTWEKPVTGRLSPFLRRLGEMWEIGNEQNPNVIWMDRGTNFDELNMTNYWTVLSRSKDLGKTWSKAVNLNIPFPAGRAYAPRKGKAGSVLSPYGSTLGELSDGSIALTGMWRNSPDGNYTSDQVYFMRSTDQGRTWSVSPVDPSEWARNESAWVEFPGGELLCLMRSNYTDALGASRSHDKGRTWTRVQPAIPYFGSSAPALLRTRENVLILAVRGWEIFTSTDSGHTWSFPTKIGGYAGCTGPANLLEMADGRVLVLGSTSANAPNSRIMGQFIRVGKDGVVRPAPAGTVK